MGATMNILMGAKFKKTVKIKQMYNFYIPKKNFHPYGTVGVLTFAGYNWSF